MTVSTRPLVIFGLGSFAERAQYYFERYTPHRVVGFTVDRAFIQETHFKDLPVVPFEEVTDHFAPQDCAFFCATGYKDGNRARKRACAQAKALGYDLVSCVADTATLNGSTIGENCLLMDRVTVEPFCTIGDGVFLGPGTCVSHDATIKGYCYTGPGVTISGFCTIGEGVFLGSGSVLADSVEIPDYSFIGLAAAVTKTLTRPGRYAGNPARLVRPNPPEDTSG